jgi:hypothetical protein
MIFDVKYCVDLIESERECWGRSLFDRLYFETLEEANQYTTEYNSQNNKKVVPDYYVYATEPRRVIYDTEGNKYE